MDDNIKNYDETNLDSEQKQFFNSRIEYLQKKFKKRHVNLYGCQNKDEVHSTISSIIDQRNIKSIGFADSSTLHEMDVFDHIEKFGIKTINPFERFPDGIFKVFGLQPDGKLNLPEDEYLSKVEKLDDLKRKALITDLFIISANAVTMNAEIVSIDGSENRVAGQIFGPKYVLIIVGRNKIVKDVDMALWNKGRACHSTVIQEGSTSNNSDRTHLIIVNEDLGI